MVPGLRVRSDRGCLKVSIAEHHNRERLSREELERAIRLSQGFFRRVQYNDGYWWGRLESNSTMEAEYLMLSLFLGKEDRARWNKICRTILNTQREDGSWSLYYGAPGDLSTSIECYFALKLAGVPADSDEMARARDFILSRGGVPKCRVFTKIWLALFGQWDWKGLPHMPPEMMLIPPSFPFSVYDFASWARPTVVPLLIVLSRHPTHPVPEWANLDELFPQPRDQTDYSLPKPQCGWGWAKSLYLLNRALGLYEKLPVHPFRGAAERKVVDWILEHQEANGGWAGIQPPWVYCLIALHHMGFPPDHEVMEKGFKGLDDHVVEDEETFFLQGCISPVWDTCLAQIALLDSGVAPDSPMMQKSTRWLLDRQILEPGDWQVRAKNVEPGGWAFEFDNDRYPDIDDTAEVIIALDMARLDPEEGPRRPGEIENVEEGEERGSHVSWLGRRDAGQGLINAAIQRGVNWVLALQSDNGGWGAFDKNNNRTYVSNLPFSDFGEVLDPSSVDVTAHILEMLGRLGYTLDFPPARLAYEYIRLEQEEDGSWFGRWGVNHIYGVSAVLTGLAAIGEDMGQPYIRRAVEWLLDHQNDDDGWGESCGSYVDTALRGIGPSTASQTAWAILSLIAAGDLDCIGIERGVEYLMRTQRADGTWDEPYFTGTGFPGYRQGEPPKRMPRPGEFGFQGLDMPGGFMINYHMYRNYWPLMALGRYARLTRASGDVRVMGGYRESADCRVNRVGPVR